MHAVGAFTLKLQPLPSKESFAQFEIDGNLTLKLRGSLKAKPTRLLRNRFVKGQNNPIGVRPVDLGGHQSHETDALEVSQVGVEIHVAEGLDLMITTVAAVALINVLDQI